MIDLRTETHTPLSHEEKGVMLKHWIELDGEKYLFKTNYKYPDYKTYSNFGEVLYTNLSKKLKFPCVESYFATTNYYEDNCNGVLVKSFFESGDEDSMSYGEMIYMAKTRANEFYYKSDYNNVESCIEVVKFVAKYLDRKVDLKQMRRDLIKMAIVDCFLGQSDRHQTNIEFIFDNNRNLRLAPTFDNGLCLSFGYEKWQVHEFLARDTYDKEVCARKGRPTSGGFMGNNNMFVISKPKMFRRNMDDNFIVDILQEATKDNEIRDLVENMLTLDIYSYLDILDMQNEVELPKDYKELASIIYNNRRREFCKVAEDNKKKFSKLNLSTDLNKLKEKDLLASEQELRQKLAEVYQDVCKGYSTKKKNNKFQDKKETDDGMLQ